MEGERHLARRDQRCRELGPRQHLPDRGQPYPGGDRQDGASGPPQRDQRGSHPSSSITPRAQVRLGCRGHGGIPDLVVAASGNLANIYLTQIPQRVSLEGIARLHPQLLPGLVRHEGIGFVMVRSEEHGAARHRAARRAPSRRAARSRARTRCEHFGQHAADNLRRSTASSTSATSSSAACTTPRPRRSRPSSTRSGRTAAWAACRPRPSCCIPAAFATQEQTVDLVGAPEVNRKIHQWIARAKELHVAGAPLAAAVIEEEQALPSVLRA